MIKKLNSKGQGALEYLLIIGGVVLVAVVVVALLIGMSSENTENSKQQSKEFIASTDLALPSTLLSVICKEKAGNDEYVVKWNPTHKEGYEYTVLFDDKPIIFKDTNPNFDLTPADNPIVFTFADHNTTANPSNPIVAECANLGSEAISIKTTNTENDTTAVSNRVFIKPQAAGTSTPPAVPSIAFNVAAGTTVLSNHGLPEVPAGDFYVIRIYNNNTTPVVTYTSERIGPGTLLNNLPIDTVLAGGFWQGRLKDVGSIKAMYDTSKITTVRIYQRATNTEILTIPVANVTVS